MDRSAYAETPRNAVPTHEASARVSSKRRIRPTTATAAGNRPGPPRTTLSPVDVIATEEATELIRERGGRLYVWIQRPRCCGSVAYLGTATEPKRGREFRSVEVDGFVLAIDARMSRLPDELHVDVRGWRRRRPVAFWDGCAWVV